MGSNGGDSEGFGAIGWGLVVVIGLVLNVLVSLWMNIGLFRGAWIALGGRKPSWEDFYRWDGAAMGRLFLMALLLLGVNILILIIAGLSGALLSLIRFELSALPLLAGLLVMIYVAVTQMFHVPLVIARGDRPVPAFQAGRQGVDPQFWRSRLWRLDGADCVGGRVDLWRGPAGRRSGCGLRLGGGVPTPVRQRRPHRLFEGQLKTAGFASAKHSSALAGGCQLLGAAASGRSTQNADTSARDLRELQPPRALLQGDLSFFRHQLIGNGEMLVLKAPAQRLELCSQLIEAELNGPAIATN